LAIQAKPEAVISIAPPHEAIAALPEALAKARKRLRALNPHNEDETADRIVRASAVAVRGGVYSVQLASESNETAALAAWQRKKLASSDLLGNLTPVVTRADLGAKGVRFRLKAGPLPDEAAAIALCAALAEHHVGCMVVRTAAGSATRSVAGAPARPVPRRPRTRTVMAAADASAMPPIAAAATAIPAPPFYVQLASRPSATAARDYWATQRAAHPGLLDRLSPFVTSTNLGAKGTVYRLKAGPLADRAAAFALCAKLAKHQLDCLVVRAISSRPAP
jgi:cell division septation protein DedD